MKIEDVTHISNRERHVERPAPLATRASAASAADKGQQAAAEVALPASQVVSGAAQPEASVASQDAARVAQDDRKKPPLSRAQLAEQVRALDVKIQLSGHAAVTFEVSSDEPPVIVLRDTETGEELRRIPPQTVDKLVEAFNELKGLLVDYRS